MTQDAKPLTADEIKALRRHLHCTELVCSISMAAECNELEAEIGTWFEGAGPRLLATIDQQAAEIERLRGDGSGHVVHKTAKEPAE